MTPKRILSFVCSISLLLCVFTNVALGAESIPYKALTIARDGMRVAISPDQKEGVIDDEGTIIIPMVYDSNEIFRICGDYIVATKNGVSYVLSRQNEVLFSSEDTIVWYYDGAHSILSRIASQSVESDPAKEKMYTFAVGDKDCKPISEFQYSSLSTVEDSNYLIASTTEATGKVLNGAVDWNGYEAIPVAYEFFLSIGTANGQPMYALSPALMGNKAGLANLTTGKIVAPCQYEGYGTQVQNGMISMCLDGKWGYLDHNGQVVIDFMYDYTWGFMEGYAKVGKDGKAGLIDAEGNYLLPCVYDQVFGFSNGICRYGDWDTILELTHPAKSAAVNLYRMVEPFDIHTGKSGSPQREWVYCDPAPYVENGRTMVPLRLISELCGYTVYWDGLKNEITLADPYRVIRLAIGSNEATVNILDDGQPATTVYLDALPKVLNGTTFVPLRFLAASGNIPVTWEGASNRVVLG